MQCEQSIRHRAQPENSGGEMNVYETLYLRDDEMDEFGDSGAYSEALEEDYEEEEAELPGVTEAEVEMPIPAPPMPMGGGGSGPSKPAAKKPAAKKPVAKKKAKK